ncbi:exopolysaccharide biosynthesis protein [Roseovarius sp. S1116L3]|uniref:exopolysaccharide biosynthesis protein n=1 Tax=Roseovarius roseus TaxID=3342636 RepID=UPI0037267AD9
MAAARKTSAVEDVLDNIRDLAEQDGKEDVSIGDVTEAIGGRGFGPLMFVPALFEETPIGAIPGVPTIIASICGVFAIQLVMGRKHAWLPGFIENRSVSAQKVRNAVSSLRGLAEWMDRHFGRRLDPLAGPVAARLAGIVILGLCLTVPPLELIPWASSVPMLSIAFLGLAMTVRDGLLMLLGFAGAAMASVAVYWFLAGSGAGG